MEQAFDLSEIVDLYKADARESVRQLRQLSPNLGDPAQGGEAVTQLRRIAHQLRGSGKTYGFPQVTRICKALERIAIAVQAKRLEAGERTRAVIDRFVGKLVVIFEVP